MFRLINDLFRDNDRGIRRVLIVAMVIGFFGLIGVGAAAWRVTAENRSHASWVRHTYEVEVAIARASVILERSEATRRGYLLTDKPVYLASYRAFDAQLGPAVDAIAELTRDNPVQQVSVVTLRSWLRAIDDQRGRVFAQIAAGDLTGAQAAFAGESNAGRMQAARAVMARMTDEERRLLDVRDLSQLESQRAFNIVLSAAGVLLATVALVALILIMRYARDLTLSRNRLRSLNDTLEEQVVERTADLSRANEEIQRFAYIVSHDLRSPLVNVMGFTAELATATETLGTLVDRVEAEAPPLLDDEAKTAAREDLPEAIGFIRSSTQKMDRLINAILKLSREGRRVIAPEPLDIAAIAEGAVAAMRRVVDERGVDVIIERPTPALVSDRLAVEQILSNLIENATKYLQPGRPGRIDVSAKAVPGRVLIAVADNGRGIDPRDHQRIFDLFRRSGAQDQPGEGIGLAHVRALAYRLGGTIDVRSTLGEGATFRLNLPALYQAPQETKA